MPLRLYFYWQIHWQFLKNSDDGFVSEATRPIQEGRHSSPCKLHPHQMDVWWDFPRDGNTWILAICPEPGTMWPTVIKAIQEKALEVSSVEEYNLSKESAALFDWLRNLPREKFEWNLSPELSDDALKTEIGITNPWNGENSFLFFRLLAEEITRQTPFVATAQPWKHYAMATARIEFRPKST
jgi:hypothetical protein